MKRTATVTGYAIAMGYVEAALVIYLRELLFNNPQQLFPLRTLDPRLAIIELVRELATIVMLATVGYLAGRNRFERGMYFIYSFAIWDIIYYVVLKIAVGWPPSFSTLDVLFLIPVMWIGPVIAPVLIAALLAAGSIILVQINNKLPGVRIGRQNGVVFLAGCGVILYSFTVRIFHILFVSGPKGLENYTPKTFDWWLFWLGYLIMCAAVFKTIADSFHKMRSEKPGGPGQEPDEAVR